MLVVRYEDPDRLLAEVGSHGNQIFELTTWKLTSFYQHLDPQKLILRKLGHHLLLLRSRSELFRSASHDAPFVCYN